MLGKRECPESGQEATSTSQASIPRTVRYMAHESPVTSRAIREIIPGRDADLMMNASDREGAFVMFKEHEYNIVVLYLDMTEERFYSHRIDPFLLSV